jgi:alpha/beta superfamily hydrolase
MRREKVIFSCGALRLEGVLVLPDGDGRFSGVVVCHPHPLYGGSMDNNVVRAIGSALVGRSIAALMFNFRGVGSSQGSFDHGRGEQDDVRAAIDFLWGRSEVDNERLGLVGYSFGASVALPVACADRRVKAVALVSLPLMEASLAEEAATALSACTIPKLLVCGDDDFVVPLGALQRVSEQAPQPKEIRVVPGADHFWWGNEGTLAETVADFFSRYIG